MSLFAISVDLAPICGLAKNVSTETVVLDDRLDLHVKFSIDTGIVPLSHRNLIVGFIAHLGDCEKSDRLMIRAHCTLNASSIQRFDICNGDLKKCKVLSFFVSHIDCFSPYFSYPMRLWPSWTYRKQSMVWKSVQFSTHRIRGQKVSRIRKSSSRN